MIALGRRRKRAAQVPITVYWCSDTHICASYVDKDPSTPGVIAGMKYLYTARQKFQHFVDSANENKPDCVMLTGDMIDGADATNSIAMFKNLWDQISLPKYLTLGNHERYAGKTRDQLANEFGYGSKTEHAGSKFNYSFVVTKGRVAIKFIVLDTTKYDGTDDIITGVCPDALISWLDSELANAKQDIVCIWMHQGVHQYAAPGTYPLFKESDALALNNSVQTAITNNPRLKVMAFYGHDHGKGKVIKHTTFGSNFPGYLNGLATVDFLPEMTNAGGYVILKIFKRGLKYEQTISQFPYPD